MAAGTNGTFFTKAQGHFAKGNIDWENDTIHAVLFAMGEEATYCTAITGAANNGAGLIRITAVAHGLANGDRVHICNVLGTTEANGTWEIANVTTDTFDLLESAFTNAFAASADAYAVDLEVEFVSDLDADSLHADVALTTGAGSADDGDLTADSPFTFTAAGGAGGKDVQGVLFYKAGTGGSTDYLIGITTEGSSLTPKIQTNGGNINVTIDEYLYTFSNTRD